MAASSKKSSKPSASSSKSPKSQPKRTVPSASASRFALLAPEPSPSPPPEPSYEAEWVEKVRAFGERIHTTPLDDEYIALRTAIDDYTFPRDVPAHLRARYKTVGAERLKMQIANLHKEKLTCRNGRIEVLTQVENGKAK